MGGALHLLLALMGPAPEPSAGVVVRWQAVEGCASQAAVMAAIELHLGRPVAGESDRPVRADATVTLDERGLYVLVLELESPAGSSREQFVAEACASLADAVALTVALAVDPVAVADQMSEPAAELKPQPEPEAEPEPKLAPEPVASPDVSPSARSLAPAPSATRKLRVGIRATAHAGFGPLPTVAPAAGLAVALLGHMWRVELTGRGWFRGRARFDEQPTVGGDFFIGSAGVRACPAPSIGPLELPVCLGVEAGAIRGVGVGVTDAKTEHAPWVAASVGPALVWPLARVFALWLDGEALVPLLRPGFTVRNLGELYRVPRSAVSIGLGVEFRMP